MARARLLLAALLAASALVVLAGPATASAPSANSQKFCKSISSIQNDLKSSSTDATSLGKNTLKKFATGIKNAAKQAPPKVQKAANSLASFYNGLANQDASAIAKAKNLSGSITTFFTYVDSNCGGS
jgi:hypothetical protein